MALMEAPPYAWQDGDVKFSIEDSDITVIRKSFLNRYFNYAWLREYDNRSWNYVALNDRNFNLPVNIRNIILLLS